MENKQKILVADDELYIRLLVKDILEPEFTVLEASNGEEAVNITYNEKPDLVLMDIRLPRLSGLEVARRLRKKAQFSHIPIIALTAHAMKGDEEKAIEAGCDSYVSKPIDTRQLPRLVARMLAAHQKQESRAQA